MRLSRWRTRICIARKCQRVSPQTLLTILLFMGTAIFFGGFYTLNTTGVTIVTPENNKLQTANRRRDTTIRPRVTDRPLRDTHAHTNHFKSADKSYCQIPSWKKSRRVSCSGAFTGYANEFALLNNFTIDPRKIKDNSKGLEMKKVIGQKEMDEYLKLMSGSFILKCAQPVNYTFNLGFKNHLSHWMKAFSFISNVDKLKNIHNITYTINDFTIAIQRYEYANLYHTMTDFYNAFLVMEFFGKKPHETAVLFIDAHPTSDLDKVWKTLFKRVIRAQTIKQPMHFKNIVWGIMGYNSPLNDHHRGSIPCVESFSKFFISQHSIDITERSPRCSELSILYLWRRNYVAHPRNPSGNVSRKIKNENEILNATKKVFPNYKISSINTETMDMHHQLLWIRRTDILISMHGAGLSHVLFLPKKSAVIELYPNYWPSSNIHFKSMAKWRGLHYLSWVNSDARNEFTDNYTYVPPTKILILIRETVQSMCNTK